MEWGRLWERMLGSSVKISQALMPCTPSLWWWVIEYALSPNMEKIGVQRWSDATHTIFFRSWTFVLRHTWDSGSLISPAASFRPWFWSEKGPKIHDFQWPKPYRIEAKDSIHKKENPQKKWSKFHLGQCEPFSFQGCCVVRWGGSTTKIGLPRKVVFFRRDI